MWLLACDTYQLRFFEEVSDATRPSYAILSHRWGEGEVTFKDVMKGRQRLDSLGWIKIVKCCEQAKADGFDYVWVDTCCIDKRSSAELSEAINSMYNWYRLSQVCYAYISDCTWDNESAQLGQGSLMRLADSHSPNDRIWHCQFDGCKAIVCDDGEVELHFQTTHKISKVTYCKDCRLWFGRGWRRGYAWHRQEHKRSKKQARFTESVWFERGWTLQELLAPSKVVFFDENWRKIGTKHELCAAIERRTKIPRTALTDDFRMVASNYCIAERMRWAAGRRTMRVEDRAYSLLGIFSVNMPLLYGEGERAFVRLQKELVKTYKDSSIFAWTQLNPQIDMALSTNFGTDSGILAGSPDWFTGHELKDFWSAIRKFSLSKEGIDGDFVLFRHRFEICVALLGHFGDFKVARKIPARMFVWYLVRVAGNEYHRISVKGAFYSILDQAFTRDLWDDASLTRIRIVPGPLVEYSLTDSNDQISAGKRSNLRHNYLRLEDLEMAMFPAKLIGCRKQNVPITKSFPLPGHFRKNQAKEAFLSDAYIRIDGEFGYSPQCVLLRHQFLEDKSQVMFFGYDLIRMPAVWFAQTDRVQRSHDSDRPASVFDIGHGMQVDTNIVMPESTSNAKKYPDIDRQSQGTPISRRSTNDRIEFSILGGQITITFLPDGDDHLVSIRSSDPRLLCRLPSTWLSV